MSLLDRLVGSAVNNVTTSLGNAIGNQVGAAIGQSVSGATEEFANNASKAASEVVDQGSKTLNNTMKMVDKTNQMAIDEKEKVLNLPPICPHCGAATEGVLVCRFCGCKIV